MGSDALFLAEPSVNILHYPCCMCDTEDDIEFDAPIVLKLKIYKPGTIKVKVNGNKKNSVEGGNDVFDVGIIEK